MSWGTAVWHKGLWGRVRGGGDIAADARWERGCVERARRGDRAAFAELYRAFAPRLYREVLVPKLGNASAAEDALSETFRTLLERLDRVDADGRSLYPWLARVATNKALDMHRVKTRTHRALANFEGLLAPLRDAPVTGAALEADQTRSRVHGAIAAVLDGMNPRYRRAIELRFLQERGREECAAAMEVKLGTFDVLLLRALRAFRRDFEARFAREELS